MAHRTRDVDSLSLKILQVLLVDARLSYRDIGARLDVAASTIGRHVKQMFANGTISRFSCRLNSQRLYDGTIVFAKIKLQHHLIASTEEFLKEIAAFPEVLEVYSIVDSGDYLVKFLVPSNADYGAFLDDTIRKLIGFEHIDSTMILNQLLRRDPESRLAFPFRESLGAEQPAASSANAIIELTDQDLE